MKIHSHILIGLFLAGFVGCQLIAFGDEKSELEGTWVLVSFERDGKEVKLQNETKAVFTGNKFVVQRGDQVVAAGTFKTDPSQKPKTAETTYTEGPDKGKSFKGIYQIDGETVKICRAGSPDAAAPTEFKTKPDSGQFVSVYKKATP